MGVDRYAKISFRPSVCNRLIQNHLQMRPMGETDGRKISSRIGTENRWARPIKTAPLRHRFRPSLFVRPSGLVDKAGWAAIVRRIPRSEVFRFGASRCNFSTHKSMTICKLERFSDTSERASRAKSKRDRRIGLESVGKTVAGANQGRRAQWSRRENASRRGSRGAVSTWLCCG